MYLIAEKVREEDDEDDNDNVNNNYDNISDGKVGKRVNKLS